MIRNRNDAEFFNTCVYGLVSMMTDLVTKIHGEVSIEDNYELWSYYEDSFDFTGDCVYLKYKDLFIKFAVVGSELIPSDISGFDYSDIKRITAVVEDCVANLSEFRVPLHSICGRLSHGLRRLEISESLLEKGSYSVTLY